MSRPSPADDGHDENGKGVEGGNGREPGARSPAAPAAPPAYIAALTEGLEEASDLELDARLRRAARFEQRWMVGLGAELAALAAGRGYRELGYRSLDHYVRERLGIAPSRARALLRIERTATASPGFRAAWRAGRLTWSQALVLVPVAALPRAQRWLRAWVERAAQVTLRRLEDDVEHAVEGERFDPAELPLIPAAPAGLQNGGGPGAQPKGEPGVEGEGGEGGATSQATGGAAEAFAARVALRRLHRIRFRAPRDVAALFRAVLATVQRRVEHVEGPQESESRALELMCEHALDEWSRHETPELRREHKVVNRDGYRCSMPGCTSYRNLHAHHTDYRSLGGSDEMENQTTLCASHHQHDVHGAGRTRVRGRAPYALRFDLPVGSWVSGDLRIERTPVQTAAEASRGPSATQAVAQE